MDKYRYDNYHDFIVQLYMDETANLGPNEALIRNVTFQVTDDCPLKCSYCYQGNKGHRMMSKETAKKAVDLLFRMYDEDNSTFINRKTKGIILEFIGGEELMNVEVMDFICGYFIDQCVEKHHPWLLTSRFSMISNGVLYFNPDFQAFMEKYKDFTSFGITLDGDKEIHDRCRVFPDGKGSFDMAVAAEEHYVSHFGGHEGRDTKVTIAPENLKDVNRIIKFFVEKGKKIIHANTVYEAEWSIEQAKVFYAELKKMADYLLERNDPELMVTLFDERMFRPLDKDNLQCWCGGAGKMLAFDPDGIAYPCIRYMPSSLGNNAPPVIIGDVNGIYQTEKQKKTKKLLESIDRRTKNTDECFNCPIADGCADCEAWNYQSSGGKFNVKSMNICNMHKARSLANVYYWNKLYAKNGESKRFEMHLPKEDALQYISEEEYAMLQKISKRAEE